MSVLTYGSDAALNLEPGLAGGSPGRAGDFGFVSSSTLQTLMARSDLTATLDQVHSKLGKPVRLDPRVSTPMARGDVFVVGQSGSGGFGDPVLRSAASVADDVRDEYVSTELAQRVYGVIINTDGHVDEKATEARRDEIRSYRLAQSDPPPLSQARIVIDAASARWQLGDSLIVAGHHDVWDWACANCDRRLAPLSENYKHGCRVIAASPEQIDANRFPNPKEFSDAPMVVRQYLCPGCGTLLGSEFCLNEDKPFHDLRIDAAWLRKQENRAVSAGALPEIER